MGRPSPRRTRIYAVKTADGGALDGRAAAKQRRRQLSQGKQALNGGGGRTAAAAGARAPALTVHRGGAG